MKSSLPIGMQQLHFRDDIQQLRTTVLAYRNARLKIEPRRQPILHDFRRQIPIDHHAPQHRHVSLRQQRRFVERESIVVVLEHDDDLIILKREIHAQPRVSGIPIFLRDELYRRRRLRSLE